MPLQLSKANAKKVEGRATQDLTAHPWAGLKARVTLIARDQAGQIGESEPFEFVLPERQFTKPLAQAVVEQRKKLVREPDTAGKVARALDALTLGGEKVIEDKIVYLGLRNAYWRLRNDQSREGLSSVVEQLWQVALRIEDGDLPEAERELKAVQDALQKALQENASPDEIKSLVDELRQPCRVISRRLPRRRKRRATCRRNKVRTAISWCRSRTSTRCWRTSRTLPSPGPRTWPSACWRSSRTFSTGCRPVISPRMRSSSARAK